MSSCPFGFAWFYAGAWVHSGAPWGRRVDWGSRGFTPARLGGRRVHSSSRGFTRVHLGVLGYILVCLGSLGGD